MVYDRGETMFRSRLSIMVASVCLFFTVGAIAQSQRTPKVMAGDATARLAQPVEPDSPGTPSTVGAGPQANGAGPGTIVPRLMKFSGALHDAAGKPVTGMVDVTFSLYSTEAGGDALWFETQSVQADDLGRYTALLGAMHTDGLPVDLFTSGEVRWLGIQVGAEAEQQPRVLLVSVPYALKAGDAETLGGKPASAYVLADAQSGTAAGTTATSIAAAALAGSKATTENGRQSNVSPLVAVCSTITSNLGGTANSLPMFTAQCNVENSMITQSGSNVGIGTASPGAQLDVQNPTTQNNIAIRATNANGTMMLIPNLSTSAYNGLVQAGDQGIIFYGTAPNAGNLVIGPWSGIGTPGIRMTAAGNVGIGTSSPGALLDIKNSTAQNNVALRAANANGTMMFIPNLGAGAYNGLVQAGDQGIIFYGTAPNAGNFVIGPWSGSGSPGVRITAAGNVGIGATAPTATLEVNGTAKFDGAATFAAGQSVTGTVTATTFSGTGLAVVDANGGLTVQTGISSPNILAGYIGNSISSVVGATISGGGASGFVNAISASYGTIGGGIQNSVSGGEATVGGGQNNNASGSFATVGGGANNTASGSFASIVGGGTGNTAFANNSSIGGGTSNFTGDTGLSDHTIGLNSTVGGGKSNSASGSYSTIPGGDSNTTGSSADHSFAAGFGAVANFTGNFVWADNVGAGTKTTFTSTAPNQFLIRASGGVGIGTASPQATLDTAGQDRRKPVTFSTLTACSSTIEGETAAVTDSTVATWGSTIAGSGSNHVLAYCDGTNWTVAAK